MSQLNNYRVGRTVLWRGAPLRIAVRTDPTYHVGPPYREPEHLPVRLSVVPLDGTGSSQERSLGYEFQRPPEPGVGPYRLELSTEGLGVGPHELNVAIGEDDRFEIPELLWVLEPGKYRDMKLAENREKFLPSPPLKGGTAVSRFVGRLIAESLVEAAFDRDGRVEWGGSQSAPEGVPEQTFASGPIGWTTRCLLSEMLDLSVFGLAAFYSNLTLTSSVFRLGVGGTLRTPLSEAEARMVTDPQLGALHLLNAREDLPQYSFDFKGVVPGSRTVDLFAEMQVDGLPIAE